MTTLLVAHPPHADLYGRAGFTMSGVKVGPGSAILAIGRASEIFEPTVRVVTATLLVPDTRTAFVRSLHQIGSPFVDLRCFRTERPFPPFDAAYGPGTVLPMLPTARFKGLGTFVHRDDPQVKDVFRRLSSGRSDVPLKWIRPGFPAIPRLVEWDLDGHRVEGVLASSVDRPGGFVVLTVADLVVLCGYNRRDFPEHPQPDYLEGLVPYESLHRLLEWTERVQAAADGRSSASTLASTDAIPRQNRQESP